VRYAGFYYQNGIVPNGVTTDTEGNNYSAATAQPVVTYTIGFGLPATDDGQKFWRQLLRQVAAEFQCQ
jgi:hypothetical protein